MSGRVLPFRQCVLKVCSRCDLACDHCYIYEHADQSWRLRPKVMTEETVTKTAGRIAEHAQYHGLPEVRVILHGGEPLLAGVARLRRICEILHREIDGVCRLDLRIHTNGVLLDGDFCQVFADQHVRVGISIDGDRAANDRHRRYADGRSSYDQVVRAIGRLREERYRDLYAGLLCTIDVLNDPGTTYAALAALEPPLIDFLLPHGTWDNPPPGMTGPSTPYADWLIEIFDRWIEDASRVPVRLFESIIRTTYGGTSLTEALGLGETDVVVVETDGSIEQVDSLKVAYEGAPETGFDVFRHTLNDAAGHPAITGRQRGLDGLCRTCRECPVVGSCGGGLYTHRYRTGTDFDNPSVYCADLMRLITHVRGRLAPVTTRPVVRPSAHALPARHLDALAAGYGDDLAVGYLVESQRSLRRATLGFVRERISACALPARETAMFNAGWELITYLDQGHRQALDEVLAHPYVRVWAARCLGEMDAPAIDSVSLARDAAHLSAIAAAAAIRSGRDAQLQVPVRDGGVHLPTLGRLDIGPGATTATITVGCDEFEVKSESGQWPVTLTAPGESEAWQHVRVLTADGAAVALEDTDPYRDCHQWPAASRLSDDQVASWQHLYRQAWTLIQREHGAYAPGLSAGLSAIMPLANDKPGREISAASRQAFGAIGAALPISEDILALLMMHEFQHVKLGAILDLFDLCDNSDQRLFYAPWRDDPRPLEALLQGTYAHIAVTDFWRARRHYLSGPPAEAAAVQFARWRTQTAEAIGTLAASGSLTPLGVRFVDGMRAAVMPWLEEPIPSAAAGVARRAAEDHRRAWTDRLSAQPLALPPVTAGASTRPGSRKPVVSGQDIAADLRALGVSAGRVLLVGASLRTIGWVDGGAGSVVAALRDVLGPEGTLVAPTGTADNSDSSRIHLARIAGLTEREVRKFRRAMRPFDPETTPSTGMGRIAEAVRTHPEAIRSTHPQTSFAALGPMAAQLMQGHPLRCHLGEDSPLGKMYDLGAWVLLLGVSFSTCTAFHLAEYKYSQNPPLQTYRCKVKSGKRGRWVKYEDVVLDDSQFATLGHFLDQSGIPDYGRVGNADCRLMPLCKIVDFATDWMRAHRSAPGD
jgi:uncharacterized protein